MNPLKRVVGALFYKFFGAGLNFVVAVLTARFLGTAGRGYLTITINDFGAYSPVFGAFSEYIPYGINKRKHAPQAVFSTALWYYTVFAGFVFVLTLAMSPWLLHGMWGIEAAKTQTAWVAGLVAPFALFHVFVTRLVWGLNELEWLNRLNTIQSIFFIPVLVLAVVIAPKGNTATYYAMGAWLLSYVLTSMVSAYVTIRVGKLKLIPRVDPEIRKEIFRFGLQLAGGRLLNQANYRIDVFLVFFLLGASHTGVYSTAVTVAEMLLYISGAIQQVVLTRISSLDVQNSTQLTARTFRHTAIVILGSYLLMVIVMPILIRVAFGKAFYGAIAPLMILLPGIAIYGMSTTLTTFFTNQLGRPKVGMYLESISIAVNVAMSFLLLPHIGETGAAWAKDCAYVAIFVFAIGYFSYATKYPFYKLFYLQPDEVEQYKSLFSKVKARVLKKTIA